MSVLLSLILGILIGIVSVPTMIHLRGIKKGWDDSNIFNVFRVLCHLALHPDDFLKMRYTDGSNPFWYLTKDEFSEVVSTRPKDN